MTEPENTTERRPDDVFDHLDGATVYGTATEKIGKVDKVVANPETGQPEWVTVDTGLLGRTVWLPLLFAQVGADSVYVPYDKDLVKNSPRVDTDNPLSDADATALVAYYEADHQFQGERFSDNVRHETEVVGTAGADGLAAPAEPIRDQTEARLPDQPET